MENKEPNMQVLFWGGSITSLYVELTNKQISKLNVAFKLF